MLNQGYQLFVDNWYTSVELFQYLHQNNTDCIGTLHKNRKVISKDIVTKKLKVSECVVKYVYNSGIMLIKCKHKKYIPILSFCVQVTLKMWLEVDRLTYFHC